MSTTFAPTRLERRQVYIPFRPTVVGDGSEHRILAIASNGDLDMHGTVVVPGGMEPITGTIPLLFSHDAQRPVGVVESVEQHFSSIEITARVVDETIWSYVLEGMLAGVSIGFVPLEVTSERPPRITRWRLYECSAVIEEVRTMPETIDSTAREVVPFGQRVLREIPASPAVHRRAIPRFSLASVVTAAVKGEPLTGFEREVTVELAKRSDIETRGIRVPAGIFQRRDLQSSPPISPEAWMQELLDDVAAARRWGTLSRRLGYTIVSSQRETVHIPRRMSVLQAGWGLKDHTAAESDSVFAMDDLSPRYASSTTTILRSALRYGDPAVDALLTRDLGDSLDDLVDTGVLLGAGGATQPTGLLTNVLPALTIDKTGDAIATPDLFRLKNLMLSTWRLDDQASGLRWCTNPAIVDRLRVTSKKELGTPADEWFSGVMPFDTGEGALLGMALVQSGRVMPVGAGAPQNTQYRMYLIYGGMGVIVYFGGASVDLLIDPYTLSTRGAVRITGFIDVNCVARDPSTVAMITNASAAGP
jgi:Phage capsid family